VKLNDRKEKRMSERVAIVVGAGGELGRATAEKLTAAGFTVSDAAAPVSGAVVPAYGA
jgi:NAD(P)-dependent dehydrogenase (short-subunit alcohol dehydrogenase family)